jgi:hypothetical protein
MKRYIITNGPNSIAKGTINNPVFAVTKISHTVRTYTKQGLAEWDLSKFANRAPDRMAGFEVKEIQVESPKRVSSAPKFRKTTKRKFRGDDTHSWAVFRKTSFRPVVTGCSRTEAESYQRQFESDPSF